jgi:hypothetical protein
VSKAEHSIEHTPAMAHIRVYDRGKCYAKRDAYVGIITVMYLDAETVYLMGAHGLMTKAIRVKALALLRSLGVRHVSYHRDKELTEINL